MPSIAIKAAKVQLQYDPADGGYVTGMTLPESTLNVTVENFNEYRAANPEESYASVDLIAVIEVVDMQQADTQPEGLHVVGDKPRPKGGRRTKS